MKGDIAKSTLISVYIITVLFWTAFSFYSKYTPTYEGPYFNYLLKPFLIGMTIIPLLGGMFGIMNAIKWGGLKSVIGKSISFLSMGLIAWSGGMIIWNYYLFFTEITVPYPSLADVIFILSWPLWTYGIFQLSRATGAKFALRESGGRVMLFIVPIVISVLSYYLLFNVARGGGISLADSPFKVFFDLFYPIGDIVILVITSLVYFLSMKFLGGIYKKAVIFLLIGFLMNYVSDFMFSYTTTKETYFNGHIVDLLFTTTMFIISFGITMFDQKKLDH